MRKVPVINVRMMELPVGLGDVVVVGYGQQKKSSVVSSIQTLESRDMNVKQRNLATNIAGRIAGVIPYSVAANREMTKRSFTFADRVRIREEPTRWVLVDGVPRNMEDIDVDEIETFTVLKDAAATAVYGAEGANGVVLITPNAEGHRRLSLISAHNMPLPLLSECPGRWMPVSICPCITRRCGMIGEIRIKIIFSRK